MRFLKWLPKFTIKRPDIRFHFPKKRMLIYLGILGSAILISGTFILVENVCKIQNIQVKSEHEIATLNGLTALTGRNILFLKEEEAEKNIRVYNAHVKEVQVTKKWPDSLDIVVQLYNPLVNLEVNEGYFVLGPEGRILEKTRNLEKKSLPIIHYYQKFQYLSHQTGDFISYQDIAAALHFLNSVEKLGMKVTSIDIKGFHMIALQINEQVIRFTTEKSQNIQDYHLETVIRQFKIEGQEFEEIDLRFDKPVIKLKNVL